MQIQIYQALQKADFDSLNKVFHALFSAIPHDWYRKNHLAEYEGYYASIFYCYFAALGLDVTAEDTTNHGRVDMTVKLDNRVCIFEFKVVDIEHTPGMAPPNRSVRGIIPINTVPAVLKFISSGWNLTGPNAISSGSSGNRPLHHDLSG